MHTISPEFPEALQSKLAVVQPGVAAIAERLEARLANQPASVQAAGEACTRLMASGGKRVRGVLAVTGYQLEHGRDMDMIGQAAGAIEAFHAHLLVLDDVADKAKERRGGPAAHIAMFNYLRGLARPRRFAEADLAALGTDAALTAGQILHNTAQKTLMDLAAPSQWRVAASAILNDRLADTGVGQLRDLLGAAGFMDLSPDEILETARLKTAYYTFEPLRVGLALAGAPNDPSGLVREYAENAGLAFQLADDNLGVFGDPAQTGKPSNDIQEGKRTWLVTTAQERASRRGRRVLERSLGRAALSDGQLDECRAVIRETGALDEANALIAKHTQAAVDSLHAAPPHWPGQHVQFLSDLVAVYGAQRQS
ncbi:MAG TPA: polyprenyl synthetase family protein [Candidatus Saccharimonadales bacterium]|nr:polyprenyl synthetase family protein [Candidatus Saccharimonadales bacterium]